MRRVWTGYPHLLVALLLAVAVASLTTVSSVVFPPTNQTLSQRLAQELQGRAVLPSTAAAVLSPPRGVSFHALALPFNTDRIDLVSYWRMPISVSALTSFLNANPPASLADDGSAWAEPSGAQMLQFDEAHVPSFAGLAMLEYSYQAAGSETRLRLDSLVLWLPPRTAATLVPRQDRFASLTLECNIDRTVDLHPSAAFRHLVSVVDGLPTKSPPGTVNCGLGVGTTTLSFSPRRSGKPNITLTDQTGCFQFALASGSVHLLLKQGGLLKIELHLLGLTAAQLYAIPS